MLGQIKNKIIKTGKKFPQTFLKPDPATPHTTAHPPPGAFFYISNILCPFGDRWYSNYKCVPAPAPLQFPRYPLRLKVLRNSVERGPHFCANSYRYCWVSTVRVDISEFGGCRKGLGWQAQKEWVSRTQPIIIL